MQEFNSFVSEYYIYFFIAAGVLFLALIGYFIENKRAKKINKKNEVLETIKLEDNTKDSVSDKTEILDLNINQ